MIQKENLTFKCATALAARRFVTVTPGTDTVAYTAEDAAAHGITLAESANGVVSVQLLSDTSRSFFYDVEDTIALGGVVGVGTDGKGKADNTSADVALAKNAVVAGSIGTGYNL